MLAAMLNDELRRSWVGREDKLTRTMAELTLPTLRGLCCGWFLRLDETLEVHGRAPTRR
jgi:hypothetical protein